MIKTLFIAIVLSLASSPSFAALTVLNVTGSSKYVTSDTEKIIFGGIANSGACTTDTGTQDTCTGGLVTCNKAAICNNTVLTITVRSDNTAGTVLMTDNTNITITGSTKVTSYTSKTDASITVDWDDLCSSLSGGNCTGGSTDTLKVGVDSNNDGTIDDVATIQVRVLDAATDVSTGTVGVRSFQFFPGDEKAYLIRTDGNIDDETAEGNKVAGLAVYLSEAADPNNPCGSSGTLSNNNDFNEIEVDSSGTLSTEEVSDSLTNGQVYVGTVALIDEAGNIGQFFDTNGTCVIDTHTVKPRPVEGLLDSNVNCFISTAAFGSPFNSKVVKFREFRDKVLKNYSWGKAFINFYYQNSPPLAKFIADHETLRTATRVALYPFWVFSILAIQIGFLGAFTVFLLSIVLSVWVVRKISTSLLLKKSLFIFLIASFVSNAQAQEDFFNVQEEKVKASTTTEKETAPLEPPYTGNEIEEIENAPTDRATPTVDENEVERPKEDYYMTKNPNKWREPIRVPEEERLKSLADEEGLFKITSKGEYLYNVKPSPQDSSASLKVAMVNFTELQNPVSGVSFSDIYGDEDKVMLLLDYEWQFFQGFGKLGVKLASGAMFANGNGQFTEDYNDPVDGPTREAKEDFLFIMFPNTLAGVYRMQFSEKQWLVPFAEAGISYFTFVESEESGDEIKFGGAPHLNFAVGGSFLLDVLGKELIIGIDRDYGVNHMWLTAEYRRFEALGADFDFTGDVYSAGIMLEF